MIRRVRSRLRRSARRRAPLLLLLLLVVSCSWSATAQTLLPPDPSKTLGGVVPFAGFVDEHGRSFESLLATTGAAGAATPWVISPIYTRCLHTCSPLTHGLRAALEQSGLQAAEYRVMSFSFDPTETAESLRAFRVKMQLPDDWLTLRAAQPAALERTLASLDFRTMQFGEGQFDHPNLVAVLAPDQRLTQYIFGIAFSPPELASAVRRARFGVPLLVRWRGYLFVVAGVGLMLSAFVFVALLFRRRGRQIQRDRE